MSPHRRMIVLGGGITGLATGWHLAERYGYEVHVVEQRDRLGGISTTIGHGDLKVDLGPHKIYTQIAGVMDDVRDLLGDELITIPKKSSVFLQGKYFNYPVGFKDILTGLSPAIGMKLGVSYAATALRRPLDRRPERTYEDYVVRRFGRGMFDLIFGPQAAKTWGDPAALSAELARTRISFPGMLQLIKGLFLGIRGKPEMSADEFYYPKQGAIELSLALARRIEAKGGTIHLEAQPVRVGLTHPNEAAVALDKPGGGEALTARMVISTIPLGSLIDLINPEPERPALQAAEALRFRSLALIYSVVKRDRLRDDAWVFFPESDIIFNRTSEQKAFSAAMVPAGKTVVCAEVPFDTGDEIAGMSDEALFERVAADLERVGMAGRADIVDHFVIRLDDVYPVYDLDFRANLDRVLAFLDSLDALVTTGRPGLFNYSNMDHCMDMGRVTADYVAEGRTRGEDWADVRRRFEEYRIVD